MLQPPTPIAALRLPTVIAACTLVMLATLACDPGRTLRPDAPRFGEITFVANGHAYTSDTLPNGIVAGYDPTSKRLIVGTSRSPNFPVTLISLHACGVQARSNLGYTFATGGGSGPFGFDKLKEGAAADWYDPRSEVWYTSTGSVESGGILRDLLEVEVFDLVNRRIGGRFVFNAESATGKYHSRVEGRFDGRLELIAAPCTHPAFKP